MGLHNVEQNTNCSFPSFDSFCHVVHVRGWFSAVAVLKIKYRSKSGVKRKCALRFSNIASRFEALCRNKGANVVHSSSTQKQLLANGVGRVVGALSSEGGFAGSMLN